MTFGEWFTAEFDAYNDANADASLTFSEIAERVGCSKSYISQLANDVRNRAGKLTRPDEELVDKIAELFGASRTKARLAAGLAPPATAMPKIDPFIDQIERKMRRVPQSKRETIQKLLLSDIDKYASTL